MLALAFAIFQLASPSPEAPYREPQLASSPQTVVLTFGSGKGIFVATSADRGRNFSKPVLVADLQVLPLGRHRGPRVAISQGTLVVTAVAGQTEATGAHAHGLPSDGDLLAWRSSDGGKTWSKAVRVNDVPAAPREGLHTLTADGQGNLFAAWLDLRGGPDKKGTRLYGAYSKDSGATWSPNVLLYESPEGGICECCHPSALFSRDAQSGSTSLEVMWRNWLGGSRDFYLIRSNTGGPFSKPEKLGQGTWKINACPMDGGGIARDGNRTVTAWRREGEVFLAEPGRAEIKMGEGKDVAVAAGRGEVHSVWIKGTQLLSYRDGKIEVLADDAAFPNIAALPEGGTLTAWESKGSIMVRRSKE